MTKRTFGDFQTPLPLARQAVNRIHQDYGTAWERILEPTCGQGNFIEAVLENDVAIRHIIGIEIQSAHVDAAVKRFQTHSRVAILEQDALHSDFSRLPWQTEGQLLVVGNPPWVTNTELSRLQSHNLPIKTNMKNLRGIEAITGKSNFDLTEYIWLRLIEDYQSENAVIALLCKTSVARNVLRHVKNTSMRISDSAIYRIDAQQWFGASVDACLFVVRTGTANGDYTCRIFDSLEASAPYQTIGFSGNNLISDIVTFESLTSFHGECHLEWRQGVKHDAARVMELQRHHDKWYNKQKESVEVESDFIYPLLKSSDVAKGYPLNLQRGMIVTQKVIGQSTHGLATAAPKLWDYLQSHRDILDNRKSSIYRNNPRFSIFGVGDYTFSDFKVLVSGFYKTPHFLPVGSYNNQPIVCDDTCYMLPCESAAGAALIAVLLNQNETRQFLLSMTFPDSKRPVTKSILKRINLFGLLDYYPVAELKIKVEATLHQMGQPLRVPDNREDMRQLLQLPRQQLRLF